MLESSCSLKAAGRLGWGGTEPPQPSPLRTLQTPQKVRTVALCNTPGVGVSAALHEPPSSRVRPHRSDPASLQACLLSTPAPCPLLSVLRAAAEGPRTLSVAA
ncbi:unnamed protein product [Staurois parvus]|uniref:Uncharacterized protein n=1 Tax=Staurois parvus TaxID=386267 RepID=A0ABN9CYV1_9NEOB|nr:unnamed protein product [Staurois parvus]